MTDHRNLDLAPWAAVVLIATAAIGWLAPDVVRAGRMRAFKESMVRIRRVAALLDPAPAALRKTRSLVPLRAALRKSIPGLPLVDGWGHPIHVRLTAGIVTVASCGSDGVCGIPPSGDTYFSICRYVDDVVMVDGQFVSGPPGAHSGCPALEWHERWKFDRISAFNPYYQTDTYWDFAKGAPTTSPW